MAKYIFERETRTPQSETFIIESDGDELGRVDLHYSGTSCYATLCVPTDFDDDSIEELIGEIDERLVMSWEPLRDDFIVTVWAGREVGVFSETGDDDDDDDEEDEDEDDDLESTNGNR
ncbi:MAG TPA: hypothetical protein VFX19_04520 [Dehalococcoidia bacterium]|nr:hypothetical protein [Dehalococcoidia bacterium]